MGEHEIHIDTNGILIRLKNECTIHLLFYVDIDFIE